MVEAEGGEQLQSINTTFFAQADFNKNISSFPMCCLVCKLTTNDFETLHFTVMPQLLGVGVL